MDLSEHAGRALRMLAKCDTDGEKHETLVAVLGVVAKEAEVKAAREAMAILKRPPLAGRASPVRVHIMNNTDE